MEQIKEINMNMLQIIPMLLIQSRSNTPIAIGKLRATNFTKIGVMSGRTEFEENYIYLTNVGFCLFW